MKFERLACELVSHLLACDAAKKVVHHCLLRVHPLNHGILSNSSLRSGSKLRKNSQLKPKKHHKKKVSSKKTSPGTVPVIPFHQYFPFDTRPGMNPTCAAGLGMRSPSVKWPPARNPYAEQWPLENLKAQRIRYNLLATGHLLGNTGIPELDSLGLTSICG